MISVFPSALFSEDRIDGAFEVAGEVFKKTKLIMKDISRNFFRNIGRYRTSLKNRR
jgi:hypothetical protein